MSASLLKVMYIWWKLISWKVFASSLVFCFQPSRSIAYRFPLWVNQLIIPWESPRTRIFWMDRKEAIVRVAQVPMSSALVFVPASQLICHLITIESRVLMIPPTPQHLPVDRAAPSNYAIEQPSLCEKLIYFSLSKCANRCQQLDWLEQFCPLFK